jgi:uncharacterized protein
MVIGNDGALCHLGMCYEDGLGGLERCPEKAITYYESAIAKGNARAQYQLAMCYQKGVGVKRDVSRCVQLLLSSAERKEENAQYELGQRYEYGCPEAGICIDMEKAEHLYLKASDQGHAYAGYALGRCWEYGKLNAGKSDEMALVYYRLAATNHCADAQCALGEFMEKGRGIMQKDVTNAHNLYTTAASNGCPRVCFIWCFCMFQ